MDLQNDTPNPDGAPSQAGSSAETSPGVDRPQPNDNGQDLPEEESFEKMLEAYDAKLKTLAEGAVVKGKVLKILPNEVIVDVGYKSEGLIDIAEFTDRAGNLSVDVGDEIDVLLEKTEDREGYVVLSKEKAEKMKVWKDVEKAYEDNTVISGRVIERIKGGLAVDIGVRAFLPGSLVDVRPVRNLDQLKGQEFRMRVIKVNKRRGNIVLSRKAVIEEENAEKKKDTLKQLKEGQVMKGVVKNLTGYGAFIDLGGIDGLLHLTDMSWGRINHPSERFNIGDEVDVLVLKFDPETERVSLGYKQLTKDPWEVVGEKYPPATRVQGKVVNLTDYGAFVELEEGVEGLIHVSEMSWTKKVKHPSKVVTQGDTIEAMVLDVDLAQRRLSLGLKQVEPNPWDLIADRYQVGSQITGKVRNLTDFGAFVEVEEGIDGLVHISDMSWTKRIKHPSELVKKGDDIEAVILKIDSENQRLSLGMKQLQPDIWEEFFKLHRMGNIVEGTIVRLTDFGAFVEIAEGIEGLVHISEMSDERIEDPASKFSVGQEIKAKIIKMDVPDRKIGLSIKKVGEETESDDVAAHAESTKDSGGGTFGDILGSSLAAAAAASSEKEAATEESSEEDVQAEESAAEETDKKSDDASEEA